MGAIALPSRKKAEYMPLGKSQLSDKLYSQADPEAVAKPPDSGRTSQSSENLLGVGLGLTQ